MTGSDANPESRDSPMCNCTSEVWSGACQRAAQGADPLGPSRNDGEKSQLAFPSLADQVLAEAPVRLGGHQNETGILIDLTGGDQDALGPQRDFAVTASLRERDAFSDQPCAQSLAATGRIDQEQPQFGDIVGLLDEKYRADLGAIEVGDPAAFARRIERGEESGRDLRHQALERSVEAVFAGIE